MLQKEDLAQLVSLLDEGRAVVEGVGARGADRERARVRLSQLLGDAIRLCDGSPTNGARPATNGSQGATWSVMASRPIRTPHPESGNGRIGAAEAPPAPSEGEPPAG